jgi:hypothetical protein
MCGSCWVCVCISGRRGGGGRMDAWEVVCLGGGG